LEGAEEGLKEDMAEGDLVTVGTVVGVGVLQQYP
jgi:hypothetical protein